MRKCCSRGAMWTSWMLRASEASPRRRKQRRMRAGGRGSDRGSDLAGRGLDLARQARRAHHRLAAARGEAPQLAEAFEGRLRPRKVARVCPRADEAGGLRGARLVCSAFRFIWEWTTMARAASAGFFLAEKTSMKSV